MLIRKYDYLITKDYSKNGQITMGFSRNFPDPPGGVEFQGGGGVVKNEI